MENQFAMNVQKIMVLPFALKLGHIRISNVIMFVAIVNTKIRNNKKEWIKIMSKKFCVLLVLIVLIISCVGCSKTSKEFSLQNAIQGSWLHGDEVIGYMVTIKDDVFIIELLGDLALAFGEDIGFGKCVITDNSICLQFLDGKIFDTVEFAIINDKVCLISSLTGDKYEKIDENELQKDSKN